MGDFLSFVMNTTSQPALVLCGMYFMLKGIRETVSKLENKTDELKEAQHSCEVSLSRHFATREDLNSVGGMVRDHEKRISRLEGRR